MRCNCPLQFTFTLMAHGEGGLLLRSCFESAGKLVSFYFVTHRHVSQLKIISVIEFSILTKKLVHVLKRFC